MVTITRASDPAMAFVDASRGRPAAFAARQEAYPARPLWIPPSAGVPASLGQFNDGSRKPRRAAAPPPAPTTRAPRCERTSTSRADPTGRSSSSSSGRLLLDDGGRYLRHEATAQAPSSPSGSTSSASNNSGSALVAAGKKPRKTNSERGKEFRARRKQQEAELLAMVSSLRREVVDLDFLHGLRREVTLRRRNALEGSLVRLALQYFEVFSNGAAAVALVPGRKRAGDLVARADRQEAFLRSVMDSEMQFGALTGWQPLLEQWRRYTMFHASIDIFATSFEVMGPEESPIVTVRADLSVVFSRDTFANVFPHAAHDEALVRKFCGRRVTYKGVNRLQFSADGRIVNYDADVGFVDALVTAGATIRDLALLMDKARIVDQCQLGDDPDRVVLVQDADDADANQDADADDNQDEDERAETKRSRFDVEFLLS